MLGHILRSSKILMAKYKNLILLDSALYSIIKG